MTGGLLLLAAAAIAEPGAADDPLVTFRDWTAGCDNGRTCMAVGQHNSQNFDLASVVVERGPLPGDIPKIWFHNEDNKIIDLAADGKRLNLELVPDADNYNLTVAPASAFRMVAALRSARALVPVRSDGKKAFPLSISGASAALRWIDEQQKRAGTVTALVATGPAPATAVPAPPPLPVVTQASPSGPLSKPFTKAEIAAIQERHAECTDEDLDDKAEYARIDAHTTLAIVTAVCGSGAYNYFGIPLLLRDGAKPVLAELGETEGDPLMNLSWDAKTGVLSSYFKGRGIGDCGGGKDWVWDGRKFVVVGEQMMGDCLGAISWITTFRARVVPAQAPSRP